MKYKPGETAGPKMFRKTLLGVCWAAATLLLAGESATGISPPTRTWERMVELTIESQKAYPDPFNDVDVDAVFTRGHESWRVPAFWRGGQRWTVRFAPTTPGEYSYRLESTDGGNPDLNGHASRVMIAPYTGASDLLKHGALHVSANKRYFEHADGTPFYWLGDTWWTGLSDRLPWDGFQTLTADRKKKGFTVVQICAGLVPSAEELAPIDPGYSNEGGPVWDSNFGRINPQYFDFADRRIQHLVDAGIAPAIVGGWVEHLPQMGIAKMKKQWRYIIARYGAYPVFWVGGGQVYDPSAENMPKDSQGLLEAMKTPGWSEVFRYIHDTDPYRHPVTVHEDLGVGDVSLQHAALTDFDLTQPSHIEWTSIGVEIAQLNVRYARTVETKPIVVGEIGYEMIGGAHLEDFQRAAFWLAMLNGAAGFTYGAAPVFEANNPDKPFHRFGQYTFMTWQEGMNLPGSYQVGLGASFLRRFAWSQFAPHPEWVAPHGTTLLEPHSDFYYDDLGDLASLSRADGSPTEGYLANPETAFPGGRWKARHGSFRQPYAAGIPRKIRVVYIPYFGLFKPPTPTVMGLERGVVYHAFFWEPMLGISFDLGTIGLPEPGTVVLTDRFDENNTIPWSNQGHVKTRREGGRLVASGDAMSVVDTISTEDAVVSVGGRSDVGGGLLLRYQDVDNYVAIVYSSKEKSLWIYTRSHGVNGDRLGMVLTPSMKGNFRLSAEVRENAAAASITDGAHTYSTAIVNVAEVPVWVHETKGGTRAGKIGIFHPDDGLIQRFDNFEIRRSPIIPRDNNLNRKLYDARGVYRGELGGPRWEDFGMSKTILLDSYRPDGPPSMQDWVLVLEAER